MPESGLLEPSFADAIAAIERFGPRFAQILLHDRRFNSDGSELDFGQKFNGLEIVRGVKYGAGQFLYCPGQAETVTKFPPYPFTLQDTALRGLPILAKVKLSAFQGRRQAVFQKIGCLPGSGTHRL